MSKGPPLFSDFGRKAKEVLYKDYSCEQKFTVVTESTTGLLLSSTVGKNGALSSGDVAAQCRLKNAVLDVKVDTELNQILTNVVVTDALPSTKTVVSIKLPDYMLSKLEAQYFHQHATFSAASTFCTSPIFDASVTIGTPTTAFGAEASFASDSSKFVKYGAGFTLTKPNYSASAILAEKGDSLKFLFMYPFSQGAAVGEICRNISKNESTLTVGCSYNIDSHAVVKAKLNNHGDLRVFLQHELKAKSFLTISSAFDTMALHKCPKFGLGLSFKP